MTNDEHDLRSYLLGELSEYECTVLERRLMTSEETFEELLVAEDELMDDYCAGELGEDAKQQFLSRVLVTGERRQQFRFAAALRAYIARRQPHGSRPVPDPDRGWWRRLFAAVPAVWRLSALPALLAIAVLGGWVALEVRHRSRGEADGSTRVSLFLASERLRGVGERPELVLPRSAKILELQLDLPTDTHPSYGIVLERAEGAEAFAQQGLKPRMIEGQRVVVTTVPASLLKPGVYRVLLNGATGQKPPEIVGRYGFRISGP